MKKKYKPFSKQWMKEFNKQSDEDKKKILQVVVEEMVNKALTTAYVDAFTTGAYYKSKAMYERYVQLLDKMDSHSEEWSTLVSKMLSEIRVDHVRYRQLQEQKEKAVFKTTEGNNAD